MAFPTSVNDQITDSVTQSTLQVLGGAGAQAAALLHQATAQALALAAEQAAAQQQNAQTLAQAATTRSVALLLGTAP